jgi:hypothetical protein
MGRLGVGKSKATRARTRLARTSAPGEAGHALGDKGDQVASRLAGVEQLVEGGVHLAVDEEAAPQLLDSVVAHVVLAQQR